MLARGLGAADFLQGFLRVFFQVVFPDAEDGPAEGF